MEGPATLADFTGTGILTIEISESGEELLTGLWQPDDPESTYDELHRLYMSREHITYRGPVLASQGEATSLAAVGGGGNGAGALAGQREERSLEVIILEWTNEEHPAALKLQEATDTP